MTKKSKKNKKNTSIKKTSSVQKAINTASPEQKQSAKKTRWSVFSLQRFLSWGSGVLIALLFLIIYKGTVLFNLGAIGDISFSGVLRRCIAWLGNDLLYFFLVWFILLLKKNVENKWIKGVLLVVALVFVIFYVADIFALQHLSSRFVFSTTLGFFNPNTFFPYFWQGLSTFFLVLILLFVCEFLVLYFPIPQKNIVKILLAFVVFSGVIIGFSFALGKPVSYQQNIIQLQFQRNKWANGASDKPYEEYFVSFSGKNSQPNIVVVFLESFSSFDSLAAGGNRSLLSGFDSIARDGIVYPNFVSNGCTSDSSHIALLQGVEPWETNSTNETYTRYKSYSLGLPAFLNRYGYNSTFLSTASLGFLNQEDFLISLQFDHIVGPEAFKDWHKYAFSAAPDEALYKKATDLLFSGDSVNSSDGPQFLVMQTISSHKPYNTPNGNTEEMAFSYADEQLFQFYNTLKAKKFFDNGLLVLVGDHRKMQSMSYEEISKWGEAAYGKSVFAVVGKDVPKNKVITTPVQHLDIYYSLKRLVASESLSLHEYYNDIFGGYQGRGAGIRYCEFVDRQYIGTNEDNSTWTILPGQENMYASYVHSYYGFQGNIDGNNKKPKPYGSANISSSFLAELNSGVVERTGAQEFSTGDMFSGMTLDNIQQQYPGLRLIAHQGYHKVDPINSLAAFVAAKEQGATAVEMDVSFTKDGYPVVIHGPDIGRIKCVGATSLGKKDVDEFTLQEMQDNCVLYNGQPILTLQETVAKIKDMYGFYFVDVKIYNISERDYIKPMFSSIKRLGLEDKIVFSSIDWEVNKMILGEKDIGGGWEITNTHQIDVLLQGKAQYILLPYDIVTQEVVEKIQNKKKHLVVYTLDDKETFEKLYDWGVRFFMTEDPQALVQ